jgi:hypothetical protein
MEEEEESSFFIIHKDFITEIELEKKSNNKTQFLFLLLNT